MPIPISSFAGRYCLIWYEFFVCKRCRLKKWSQNLHVLKQVDYHIFNLFLNSDSAHLCSFIKPDCRIDSVYQTHCHHASRMYNTSLFPIENWFSVDRVQFSLCCVSKVLIRKMGQGKAEIMHMMRLLHYVPRNRQMLSSEFSTSMVTTMFGPQGLWGARVWHQLSCSETSQRSHAVENEVVTPRFWSFGKELSCCLQKNVTRKVIRICHKSPRARCS